MKTIGERIRERRIQLEMSQDELAKRLGYKSRSSINKIESGDQMLTQSKIAAIAKELQVTPSYIMGWDDGPEPEPIILSPEELEIISAYRSADAGIKDAIAKLLDIDRQKKEKLAM